MVGRVRLLKLQIVQMLIDLKNRQFVHGHIGPTRKMVGKRVAIVIGRARLHLSLARCARLRAVFDVLFQSITERRDAQYSLLCFVLIACLHIARSYVMRDFANLILAFVAHCANLTDRVFCDVGSHLLTYHVLTPPFVTQRRNPLTVGSVNHVVLVADNFLSVESVNLIWGI